MKLIKDVKELKAGDSIAHIKGDKIIIYEYLMVHPHNNKYILMLEPYRQTAEKFYIPDMINNDCFLIYYSQAELYECVIEWHKKQIAQLERWINKENNFNYTKI